MFRQHRSLLSSLRLYSTTPLEKPSIKLVAELRKRTEVSVTKARDALAAVGNDVEAALQWLEKDLAISGAKKAAKLEGRTTGEGLIATCILSAGTGSGSGAGSGGVRAAMVELNCETDFVGRNELFGKLLADIAHTAAFISEPSNSPSLLTPFSIDALKDAPLISHSDPANQSQSTVSSAIRDAIAKVGENISLKRAVTIASQRLSPTESNIGLRVASYVHGGVNLPSQGRIGTLALLALKSPRLPDLLKSTPFQEDLHKLERSLARQIVGFDTRIIRSSSNPSDETALYAQPFMMMGGDFAGQLVQAALDSWCRQKGLVEDGETGGGVEVLEFAKWTVGEETTS
ncbi:hypothetical protein JAAARDRAFT_202716 [Jaapia argillacea MUCL 33604]|uniref:Elongation factor Ts, mitochondrial n=1 Tax=Jaapia argillacea MUCL 33604 TaxID=933084 RepID=A0A067QAP2_9AGAM|nr:hypothetical protein JAAARDRAFT_202716 [Jaapia argillacea MUCL 33604]